MTRRAPASRPAVWPLLAALAALAAWAGGAERALAVPFGADLNRPADNPFPCSVNPALGIPWIGVEPPQSCTWSYAGSLQRPGEVFNVPAGEGVLTAARVRVGPQTGPMQIAVFRSLRAPDVNPPPPAGGIVCCTIRFTSQVFTPAPNGVTTIRLPNVPVVNDRVPQPTPDPRDRVLRFDTIALTVLAPNVPVPAQATRNLGDGGFGFYPGVQAGQERFEGTAALGGFVPLLNGEWVPTPVRASGVSAQRLRNGARAAFRLAQRARVRTELLRRVVLANRSRGLVKGEAARRVVLRRVGRPVVRTYKPGRHRVTLRAPKGRKLAKGRYVVRLRVTAFGKTSTATKAFVVRR